MKMILTKTIPEHIETEHFNWCSEFIRMSMEYRNGRKSMKKNMNECYWCEHEFEDSEMMYLASGDKENVVLCHACADSMKEEDR